MLNERTVWITAFAGLLVLLVLVISTHNQDSLASKLAKGAAFTFIHSVTSLVCFIAIKRLSANSARLPNKVRTARQGLFGALLASSIFLLCVDLYYIVLGDDFSSVLFKVFWLFFLVGWLSTCMFRCADRTKSRNLTQMAIGAILLLTASIAWVSCSFYQPAYQGFLDSGAPENTAWLMAISAFLECLLVSVLIVLAVIDAGFPFSLGLGMLMLLTTGFGYHVHEAQTTYQNNNQLLLQDEPLLLAIRWMVSLWLVLMGIWLLFSETAWRTKQQNQEVSIGTFTGRFLATMVAIATISGVLFFNLVRVEDVHVNSSRLMDLASRTGIIFAPFIFFAYAFCSVIIRGNSENLKREFRKFSGITELEPSTPLDSLRTYVSFSDQDQARSEQLLAQLVANNIAVNEFRFHQQDLFNSPRKHLEDSDFFIVFLSPDSRKSYSIGEEITYALDWKKRSPSKKIIVVKLDDVESKIDFDFEVPASDALSGDFSGLLSFLAVDRQNLFPRVFGTLAFLKQPRFAWPLLTGLLIYFLTLFNYLGFVNLPGDRTKNQYYERIVKEDSDLLPARVSAGEFIKVILNKHLRLTQSELCLVEPGGGLEIEGEGTVVFSENAGIYCLGDLKIAASSSSQENAEEAPRIVFQSGVDSDGWQGVFIANKLGNRSKKTVIENVSFLGAKGFPSDFPNVRKIRRNQSGKIEPLTLIVGHETEPNVALEDVRGGACCISNRIDVTFSNCRFENSSAEHGGAVAIYNSADIEFRNNCLFSGNTASKKRYANGGAVWITWSEVEFNQCNFDSNRAVSRDGAGA